MKLIGNTKCRVFFLGLIIQEKIAIEFGKKSFTKKEIEAYKNEYDRLLDKAELENENIASMYYKDKAKKLVRRLRKYKNNHLYFIHDFSVPFDSNAIERDLRMIKNKTKISGGFRSFRGPVHLEIL